ncbi:SAM-dependent methyltransferase [Coxiella endosymbiont of Amblyomma sculptum]|uniref:class I SAM-dependent methyltransferase n=1 Tax=Coxiella endosymbiont of Amblyomma sculptum TaxID=2487929 RepID=UPI00132F2775|nr:class I SAM-dependent methyltransferase [Coxiella endosymbiont of Amblyomma sculptum]QHG92220.1 SAM-dependent methyltransferase [Coxiella endosymbiont of Amblyomma sculptum]
MINIAIVCLDKSRQKYAESLATELKLSLVSFSSNHCPVLLVVTPTRLELRLTDSKSFVGPVYVDFLNGVLRHRRLFGGGRNQLIARAIGLKTHYNPIVLDLTAGLSRDAFILADLGCKVTMLERNPIISTLLKEGLYNATKTVEWFRTLQLELIESEAQNYLLTTKRSYEVIYIDPMYPIRKKSALSKKEMRILRYIVGRDEDSPRLLKIALKKAKRRVVVKRPSLAPKLANLEPTYSYKGRSSRFDIYLIR